MEEELISKAEVLKLLSMHKNPLFGALPTRALAQEYINRDVGRNAPRLNGVLICAGVSENTLLGALTKAVEEM